VVKNLIYLEKLGMPQLQYGHTSHT